MTLETLYLLKQVLGSQQLMAGAEDFAVVSRLVVAALAELDEAIAAQSESAGS